MRYRSFSWLISLLSSTLQAGPIAIQAEQASANLMTSTFILKKHVHIKQDQHQLHAEQVTLMIHPDHTLKEAIAKGSRTSQAHFSTMLDDQKTPLDAYADTIHYEPLIQRITLSGHARILRHTDLFSAPEIVYDLSKQSMITRSTQTERTKLILSETHDHLIRDTPRKKN